MEAKGLEGLPGLYEIDEELRKKYLLDNEERLRKYKNDISLYRKKAEIMFNNDKFRNLFGEDEFNRSNDGTQESYNLRNERVREHIINSAFDETFKEDKNYLAMKAELDTEGRYSLLNNPDYIGSKERERRYQENLKKAEEAYELYELNVQNPMTSPQGRAAAFTTWQKTASRANNLLDDDIKHDNDILNGLYEETRERREQSVQDITDNIYQMMLDSDAAGDKSMDLFLKEFDELATEKSKHYQGFKDSKWLKNYSDEDKLKDYAKYVATKSTYGDIADYYLERDIQNRIAEEQDGKWTANTAKGLLTTAYSDLGSNIAFVAHFGESPERMAVWLQGKDPNKPVYDKNGEIVDYEYNDDWWTDPHYWNHVYTDNTFSPTEIRAIQEQGGISPSINVKEFGATPKFLSWETAQEGFKQLGHIVDYYVESAILGGAGKVAKGALKPIVKGSMKSLGASAEAMAKVSKTGDKFRDLVTAVGSSKTGAQLEAMGAYEQALAANEETIQNQIRAELNEYYNQIDYTTPEALAAMQTYYNQLKEADMQRVKATSREGVVALPASDEMLLEQAKQQYTSDLLQAKQTELEDLHAKDKIKAAQDATKAYSATFAMDLVKDLLLDLDVQKFKFAKGSMTGALDNPITRNITGDEITGGVKKINDLTSFKEVSKMVGKQLGGGFIDEYLDGINASFGEGVSSNEFNNYINKLYNPEAYNEATEGIMGNLLAGIAEGSRGLTERENLYEGFIGMVSPVTAVGISPNVVFHPVDTWKAVVQGKDANGASLNLAERLSYGLSNALIQSYGNLAAENRATDNAVEAINKMVSENKATLEEAAKLITASEDYSSLGNYRYGIEKAREDDEEDEGTSVSMLDSQDQKLYNAFTLADVLNTLESIDGGTSSPLYQRVMSNLEGHANGTLSQEEMNDEIEGFLANPDNKSVLSDSNNREVAIQRMQENSAFLLETKEKLKQVYDTFSKSSSFKGVDPRVKTMLAYNILAEDNYKQRLKELNEQLGVSETNVESVYTPDYDARYGTQKALINAVEARERSVQKLTKKSERVADKIKNLEEKIETLQKDVNITSDKETESQLQSVLDDNNRLLQSYKFQHSTLENEIDMLHDEISALRENIKEEYTEPLYTEEYIMGLDARDRAEMFNNANRNNYSKKQLKAIDSVKKKMVKKDAESLTKIRDAGILANRIQDLNDMYAKILDKHELAATYLNAKEILRTNAAMTESLQRGIEEHYSKIEKAYDNRYGKKTKVPERREQELKASVLETNTLVLDAYMEDHPEQSDAIRPYYSLREFDEEAFSIISTYNDIPPVGRTIMLKVLDLVNNEVNSKQEAIDYIKNAIGNKSIPEEVGNMFTRLLSDMDKLNNQRDAVNVETKEEKKEEETPKEEKKETKEESKKTAGTEEGEIAPGVEGGEIPEGFGLTDKEDIPIDTEEDESSSKEGVSEETFEEEITEEEIPVVGEVVAHTSDGDTMVRSLTIEEEATQASDDADVKVSDDFDDNVEDNSDTETTNTDSSNEMPGNYYSEWESKALDEHKLVHKKGANEGDEMDTFFAWLKEKGIKLQNIIDDELAEILYKNPKLNVKFMYLRTPADSPYNSTLKKRLFLVVDYDDSINKDITSIHHEDNGGIILTNGKRYLVIGASGYKSQNKAQQEIYDGLFSAIVKDGKGIIRKAGGKFFAEHPSETYYVHEGFHTEIIPGSMIQGFLIRQGENDKTIGTERKVSTLLNDKERNPHPVTLETAAWAISTYKDFVTVKTKGRKVSVPRNKEANVGRVFLLVPSGNGKLIPAPVKPLLWNDSRFNKDSELAADIDQLFRKLVSINYNDRLDAVKDLSSIFLFGQKENEGHAILIGTDSMNRITIKNDTNEVARIELDKISGDQAYQDLLTAIGKLNPRINVSVLGLSDSVKLRKLDEAGALMIDLAKFGTAGVSYKVYAVDTSGNILKPTDSTTPGMRTSYNGDYRDTTRVQVPYRNGIFYFYDRDTDTFSLDGKPISASDNPELVEKLKYALEINDRKLIPAKQKGTLSYYILDEVHNVVVTRDSSSGLVNKLSETEAKGLIEGYKKEMEAQAREKEAKKELDRLETQNQSETILEDEEENDLGQIFNPEQDIKEEMEKEEEKKKDDSLTQPKENMTDKDTKGKAETKGETQTFNTFWRSRGERKNRTKNLLNTKWPETVGMNASELTEFLRGKIVDYNSVPTSEIGFNAWYNTIVECR